jgi:hypothetical protein
VATVLVLAAALSGIIGMYAFAEPRYGASISAIEVSPQQGGGNTTYLPILSSGSDWNQLDDADREGTARFAIQEATRQAETDGVTTFSVMGLAATDREPVFLYTGGTTFTIFVRGESHRIPFEP